MEIFAGGENLNDTNTNAFVHTTAIHSITPFDVHRIIFHSQFAIKTNTMTRNDCVPISLYKHNSHTKHVKQRT